MRKDMARDPFGMRYAATQTTSGPDTSGVTYSSELQIALAADGNPWAASNPPQETSTNTNLDSKNDEGTDMY
jgi:putative ATP-grasp target RiPP